MTIRAAYLLPILFLILFSICFAQEEYLPRSSLESQIAFKEGRGLPYPGIIHIHSSVSEGIYPLRKIVSLAKDRGIKILIFSDSFLRRWEYGLPIFSNIFKVALEERSVAKYGIKRYLADFKKLKKEFSEMLILEGVEVAPFYWWSGSLFKKNLTLNDWNRHLLVTGLKNYQDYRYLPVVGNRYFLPQLKDIPLLLICLSLVLWGSFFLKKRKKFLGWTLNIAGILCLLNFFPFSSSRYSPYFGQKEFSPHQDLINYVHKKRGLVFWAHPEVTELVSSGRFATINFYTPSYTESLILTSGYTGFGVNLLPGTSHDVILAGNKWDEVLMSYCQGKRSQPVWVIGEADYRGTGSIDAIQNIFFLPKFKPDVLYEALRKGRFYARYYSNLSLDDFYIIDESQDKIAFMGEELETRGKPKLCIKGSYNIGSSEDLRIELIRNGKIIKEFTFNNEGIFDLEFLDDSQAVSLAKSYYRLNFFVGGKIVLVTNPIFVTAKAPNTAKTPNATKTLNDQRRFR